MEEYYCPNCGAILNDQPGFDPSVGTWTCTECGEHLMDDDIYEGDSFEGVAWYCDSCGALLNRQPGFSDSLGTWECTNCGYENTINEDEIINIGPKCPNCGSYLKNQTFYSEWENDLTCEDCGAKLHRDYSSDPFEIVDEDDLECPKCGCSLKDQTLFGELGYDWTCEECGAKLHRENSSDPFEIVDEDKDEDNDEDDDEDDNEDDDEDYDDDDDDNGAKGGQANKKAPSDGNKYESNVVDLTALSDLNETTKGKMARFRAFLFSHKKVKVGFDAVNLLLKRVDEALLCLRDRGLKNIALIPVKDVDASSSWHIGEVEYIKLGSKSEFSTNDHFDYNTQIVIRYHDIREIIIPFSAAELRKQKYKDVRSTIRGLGFIHVAEIPIKDLITGWLVKDGTIETLSINGNSRFDKNTVYKFDATVLIKYHTFRKQR